VQRARLLQGTASLNRGSDSIARSHQVAAETDQVADEIVSDLGVQRQSLLRTQDRVLLCASFCVFYTIRGTALIDCFVRTVLPNFVTCMMLKTGALHV